MIDLVAVTTTLRLRDGQRLIQDGPYGESKEPAGSVQRFTFKRPRPLSGADPTRD
jgi:hypothetical protein